MRLNRGASIFATISLAIMSMLLARTPLPLAARSGQVLQGGVQQNAGPGTGDVFATNSKPETYQDQSSRNCSEANTSPFAGMNPLICHGVTAPADSAGQCSLRGMRLLKHVGNTCYYCQLLKSPINGIIIPLDQVGWAGQQGFKCGVDEAAPNCMAVCWRVRGNGPYTPPNAQPSPGSPSGNGPPPSGGVSTSGGPCLPFGLGGYNYCNNPTQPPGCVCPQSLPPGNKGVTRRPDMPSQGEPNTPARPNLPAVDKAMSACLSATVPYLLEQTVQPAYMQMARASAPASAQSTPLAQLPAESQIFMEETAMGLQAQAAHNSKYGENEYNPTDAKDYMVGWLDHCLYNASLEQKFTNNSAQDPRAVYAKFLGVALTDHRIDMFSFGYQDISLPPLPLMPPRPPRTNP